MATYLAETYAAGGNTGVGVQGIGTVRVERVVVNVPDFIKRNATLTTNKKITAADVFQIIHVPASTLVEWVAVKVVTPCTAGTTIDVGVGGSEFLSNVDAVTLGTTISVATTTANTKRRVFATADTIDVVFDADETKGEFIVFACMNHLK
jgi:hypothetical protein